jgi:hypothetical protein
MPHALTELKLNSVTKPADERPHEIRADVCVVGAGIAGLSAAIESARLGRDVLIVDSLPLIGGQMVHSLIGLFCGVFGNAPRYQQLTHGVFDDIFRALGPAGDLHFQRGHTTTVYYNEVALGRWLERAILASGVRAVLGTVLQQVSVHDGRIDSILLASRYGNVSVSALGFVDATGDAALTWEAGLPCWVPERPIYGSQQVIVENVDENHKPDAGEMDALIAAHADERGLLRRGGLAFFFPGRGTAVLNVTHIEAPLDPIAASRAQLDGKAQADRVIALLRAEFPRRSARPGSAPTDTRDAAKPAGSRAGTSSRPARSGRARGSRTRWRARPGRSNCTIAPTATCGRCSTPTTCTTSRCAA